MDFADASEIAPTDLMRSDEKNYCFMSLGRRSTKALERVGLIHLGVRCHGPDAREQLQAGQECMRGPGF